MVSAHEVLSAFAKTEELLDCVRRGRAAAEALVSENESLRATLAAVEGAAERRIADLERQNETLANLYVATCQLLRSRAPRDVARSMAEIAAGLLGAHEYAIFLADGDDLVLVEGENVEDRFSSGRVRRGEGLEGRALEAGEAFVGEPGSDDEQTAFVPLRAGGRWLGAVGVYCLLPHKPGPFTAADLELLNVLAEQGAAALGGGA